MGIFTDALNNLRTAGFPERSLPGILGNIGVETGYTYDWQQKQHKGGPGYGLFQFDAQKQPYFDWLGATGKQDSGLSQAEYVYASIYDKKPKYDIGPGHRRKLKRSFDDDDTSWIATEFMDRFERPKPETLHWEERMDTAKKFEDLQRKGMLK
jgi:hypothetical protein